MRHRPKGRALSLAMLVLSLLGCYGSDSAQNDGTPSPPRGQAAEEAPAIQDPAEQSEETAADALQAVVRGFRQNRPQAFWEFLPPSYQQDVGALARDFAEQMDPELWDRSFALVRRTAELLRTRKRDFLEYGALAEGNNGGGLVPRDRLAQRWDGLVGLLDTLADSDIADLQRMKSFDGGEFFARFGDAGSDQLPSLSILLAADNPFSLLNEMLAGAEVTSEQTGDAAAVVTITPKDGGPRQFDFVLVEDHWIPASWAGSWQDDLNQARRRMAAELDPEVLDAKKKKILPVLQSLEESLETMQQAESTAAFHALLDQQIGTLVMLLKNSQAPQADVAVAEDPAVEPANEPAGGPLKIVIHAALDEQTTADIADRLLAAIDDQKRAIVEPPIADARTVTIRVFPVADIREFAARLDFLKVLEIHEEERTIITRPVE